MEVHEEKCQDDSQNWKDGDVSAGYLMKTQTLKMEVPDIELESCIEEDHLFFAYSKRLPLVSSI